MLLKLYYKEIFSCQIYSFNHIPPLIFLGCIRKICQAGIFGTIPALDAALCRWLLHHRAAAQLDANKARVLLNEW